jgi:hypothetical protein
MPSIYGTPCASFIPMQLFVLKSFKSTRHNLLRVGNIPFMSPWIHSSKPRIVSLMHIYLWQPEQIRRWSLGRESINHLGFTLALRFFYSEITCFKHISHSTAIIYSFITHLPMHSTNIYTSPTELSVMGIQKWDGHSLHIQKM